MRVVALKRVGRRSVLDRDPHPLGKLFPNGWTADPAAVAGTAATTERCVWAAIDGLVVDVKLADLQSFTDGFRTADGGRDHAGRQTVVRHVGKLHGFVVDLEGYNARNRTEDLFLERAHSRGVSRTKFQIIAFVITAFFTGMTGGVHAAHFRFTGTSLLELPTTVFILAMAIVGGLKSTWGPVLGGVVMMVLLEVAKSYGDVRNTLLGVVLVGFVLLLPKGVAGAGSSILAALGRREKVQKTVGEEHAGQAQNA
jgi:Branched-chain amino acid transport system / permease component